MTIQVQIHNADEHRAIEVTQVDFDRNGNPPSHHLSETIGPKGTRTFYVHLLRELHISEKDPDHA